jgi:hypothetical protein
VFGIKKNKNDGCEREVEERKKKNKMKRIFTTNKLLLNKKK